MKIGEQTQQAHQQLPSAEHPALGTHGEKERGARRAQAEKPVPERIPAAPTDGAEHIVQKSQPQTKPTGEQQREGLAADAERHSAKEPRPEAALGGRLLVAQLAYPAAYLKLPGGQVDAVNV